MPMRWTPENDQTLLLKIIEVSNVNPDTRAIAELWPTKDGEERPTPRAITERLHKIRAQVRAGGGNFSISGKGKGKAPTKDGKDPLKPKAAGVSTPRKPRLVKNEEPPTPESSTKVKQEANAMPAPGLANLNEEPPKSDSGNHSDGGSSSQQEPLTPASAKRKHSFDIAVVNTIDGGQHTAHEAEDVPVKRQMMASPAPPFHHSFGSMPMDMPMPNFGMNMGVQGFQYMDQNEA